MNKVMLIGNLGADPEVRRLNSGAAVVNMRIATSERWRDKNTGEKKERTEWHQIVIFNEQIAKIVEQYCHKGDKVFIEGKLQTRKWQDQQGNDRYSTEVVLQNFDGKIELLSAKRDGGGGSDDDRGTSTGGGDHRDARRGNNQSRRQSPPQRDMDDEIPFDYPL